MCDTTYRCWTPLTTEGCVSTTTHALPTPNKYADARYGRQVSFSNCRSHASSSPWQQSASQCNDERGIDCTDIDISLPRRHSRRVLYRGPFWYAYLSGSLSAAPAVRRRCKAWLYHLK